MLRKLTLVLVSTLSLTGIVHSQSPVLDWSDEMKNPDRSFEEFVNEHRANWAERPTERGQGYKQVERYISLYQSRLNANGHVPIGSEILHTWEEVKAFQQNRSLSGNWYSLGPIIDEVTNSEMIPGVGRMQSIAFHPTNSNIVLSGAPAGGVWRSIDGGATWSTNTDNLPTLGVSSIRFDPTNPDIVYAGTGDRDASDSQGMGVLKSLDGGITWDFFSTGIENTTVGCIRFQPGTGHVFIGTDDGIFKSQDQGVTWEQVSQNTSVYKDFEFHPLNGNIIYSTASGKFFRSENGGVDWDWIVENIGNSARMSIAVTPADPDVVYVIKCSTYAFSGFYKSTDTGLTFVEMSDSPNIMGWAADGSSSGGQAWYDLCLEADAEHPEIVYVGGIRLKKSLDSGATWMDINPNYVHVDQHEMTINPHNMDLYVCNDGGLYHYQENDVWVDISAGIVTGQIYQLGQSNHNPNHTLCGFQDNGTMEFDGVYWRRRGGGDGFECAYDFTQDDWRYGSIYYGDVYRTTPAVVNEKIAGLDVLDINEEGAWNTPWFLSKHDSTANTMYVGLKNVWRTQNIKHPEKDSIVWMKISDNITSGMNINEMEQNVGNPNIMYVAKDNRKLYRTNNALAEEPTWENISTSLPLIQVPVNAIETNPLDSNIVYICFNSNVYKSTDQGETWASLSDNMPDIVTNTMVLDLTDPGMEALYVGTDMGVYYRDTLLNEFIPFNQGMPISARVTELEIYYGSTPAQHRLKASTYGRGLWESDLYNAEAYTFPAVAAITSADNTNEAFGPFDVNVIFYKSLDMASVTGFDNPSTDILAENATVLNISGGPSQYTATIQPTSYGEVKLWIPNAAALDQFNNPTFYSDTLVMTYAAAPEELGPYGPAGVGDNASVTFWLRADRNVTLQGNQVSAWGDALGSDNVAIQNSTDNMPELLESGISGRPAISFDGGNDLLQMNDVVPGRSISAFIMVETDSIKFNEHGWFASSRMPNGYLMHPWKNDFYYHNEVADIEGNFSGINSFYIGDASAPHIYGFVYHQDDLHQVMNTFFDDDRYPQPGVDIGLRDNTTPIDIDFGHDYGYENERFGRGRIAEHFVFSRRLMETHINLVNNYMASKYQINLGPQTLYSHPDQNLEVIGIGRETAYDFHDEAKGFNLIHIKNPTSLDNNDYLLVGNDEGSLNVINNMTPFLSPRVERTWGFTETGDVGTVTIRIEGSELTNTQDLGLIITSDDEFMPGSQVTFVPLLIQGPVLEATVDFPSSGVFTLGTLPTLGQPDYSIAEANIFPNPAQDFLQVNLKNAWPNAWQIIIHDMTGRMVEVINCSGKSAVADLKEFTPGIYNISVMIEGEVITREMVVKQNR